MTQYIEVSIPLLEERKDVIIAELEQLGYEGFWDQGTMLVAYIPQSDFLHKRLYDTLGKYQMENSFSYKPLEDRNWNEEWEKNYDPIIVDDRVYIRSPFHKEIESIEHEIIIQPQMSFGTGHHETTQLVIQMMLTLDFTNKKVLDMGTGTGVLAFLAQKLGAGRTVGIDYDLNSVNNAEENLKYNKSVDVSLLHGSAEAIPDENFDIVLSNITKNINMTLLPHLAKHVSTGGYLVLAGFLNFDLKEVDSATKSLDFELIRNISLGDWESLMYKKL